MPETLTTFDFTKMSDRLTTDDIAYFIAFCVENYKNAHSLRGNDVSTLFAENGVMEYLEDNYEVLHTQSPQWLLSEIDDIIQHKSL